MLFDRSISIFSMASLKQHMEYFNFRCLIQLDVPSIQGKGYKEAVGQLADLLAMERHSPLDNAVWLLEYVSRTKGAEHLKMASRNLNLLQYFCIDVLVFLIIVCAIIGIALRKFFRELVPWISQRKYVVPIKIPFIIAFATAVHYINKHVQLL